MERTRLLHTAKHHVQFVRAAEDDQAAGEEHHARKRQRTGMCRPKLDPLQLHSKRPSQGLLSGRPSLQIAIFTLLPPADGSVDAAQIYQEVLSRPPEPKSAAAPTAQHAARRPPPPKKQAPAKREPTETERQRARLAMLKAAQDGDADGVVQLLREVSIEGFHAQASRTRASFRGPILDLSLSRSYRHLLPTGCLISPPQPKLRVPLRSTARTSLGGRH